MEQIPRFNPQAETDSSWATEATMDPQGTGYPCSISAPPTITSEKDSENWEEKWVETVQGGIGEHEAFAEVNPLGDNTN